MEKIVSVIVPVFNAHKYLELYWIRAIEIWILF